MAQEIGESREAWGWNVVKLVEDFYNNTKNEEKPFYIVYACKPDTANKGVFRQTIKAYRDKPPALLGILVWYADHKNGILDFVSDLSSPPDMPLDPNLLSLKSSDSFTQIMEKGEKFKVLVS